jgi:hypothetical protein
MIKIDFDFSQNPPQINIANERMTRDDVHMLRTTFFQMSKGSKFPVKFTLEISGLNIKITPLNGQSLTDLNLARNVFKNLVKDAAWAYRDF